MVRHMDEIVTFGGKVTLGGERQSNDTERFLEMFGDRVRAARTRRSISRKTLS